MKACGAATISVPRSDTSAVRRRSKRHARAHLIVGARLGRLPNSAICTSQQLSSKQHSESEKGAAEGPRSTVTQRCLFTGCWSDKANRNDETANLLLETAVAAVAAVYGALGHQPKNMLATYAYEPVSPRHYPLYTCMLLPLSVPVPPSLHECGA